MKAKNFKNGAEVRIKPSAGEIGMNQRGFDISSEAIGSTGTLELVQTDTFGPYGMVNGWTVRPKHVSLVKLDRTEPQPVVYAGPNLRKLGAVLSAALTGSTPTESELTRGYYVDGDGDLWVIAGSPLRAANAISARRLADTEYIKPTYLSDGLSIPDLIYMHSDKPWWPLRKVADLPE